MKQIEHEEDERVRFAGIGCRLHKAEGRRAVRSAAAQLAIKVCLLSGNRWPIWRRSLD
jgi:hypothetical protein